MSTNSPTVQAKSVESSTSQAQPVAQENPVLLGQPVQHATAEPRKVQSLGFSDHPQQHTCQHCGHSGTTRVAHEPSTGTHCSRFYTAQAQAKFAFNTPTMGLPNVDQEAGLVALDGQARECTPTWADLASKVPYQAQQVLISWIFIWASITLFLDFAALQAIVAGHGDWYFAKLCNWFGVVSCVLWFWGFVVLVHWLKRINAPFGSQLGGALKLVAAVFFNLQPMTGTAFTRGGAGIWWSNLVGIIFFHSGNVVSCFDFYMNPPPGTNMSKGLMYHANLPITFMWIYQISTWFLVPGNLIACDWNGVDPSAQWVDTSHWAVIMCQYVGSLGLLLGSLVCCAWCDGFRTVAL